MVKNLFGFFCGNITKSLITKHYDAFKLTLWGNFSKYGKKGVMIMIQNNICDIDAVLGYVIDDGFLWDTSFFFFQNFSFLSLWGIFFITR